MDVLKLASAEGRAPDPAALLAAIPYCRHLGLSVETAGSALVLLMPFAPHLIGNPARAAWGRHRLVSGNSRHRADDLGIGRRTVAQAHRHHDRLFALRTRRRHQSAGTHRQAGPAGCQRACGALAGRSGKARRIPARAFPAVLTPQLSAPSAPARLNRPAPESTTHKPPIR